MKRIGVRTYFLLVLAIALAGCKAQMPLPAGQGEPQPRGDSGESSPRPRQPSSGNGEAYNGPNLAGPSLPSRPRPHALTVTEIENAVMSCHDHFVRRIVETVLEGPVTKNGIHSWQGVHTRAASSDPRAFFTQTQGHWRVVGQSSEEYEVNWSALGGKLVPLRRPPEEAFFNLEIRSARSSRPLVEWKLPNALPLLAYAVTEADDILSPHNFREDRLVAEVSHVWFQNTDLKLNTRDNEGLPLRELGQCLQFTLAEGREAQPGSFEKWEAQDRFVKSAFQRLRFTANPTLLRLLNLSAPENHPLQIIFWDRPERAGVHRTTHHVGLNPNLRDSDDALFLLVHELAHRAQPNLEALEQKFKTLYYRTMRIGLALKKKPSPLTARIRQTMTEYVDVGLELQLLNEWRVWTAAFDIYLNVKAANADLGTLAPWKEIAWVENILAEKRSDESLKHFVFRYLDERFTDQPDPERPYLDVILRERRKALREEMDSSPRSLGDLEFIY